MSHSDPDPPEADPAADVPGDSDAGQSESAGDRVDADGGDRYARFKRYVDYAVLAGLLLLAFVAVVQFYFAASSAIGTWVTYEYRAPFRAAFNLVVLLLAGLGVSLQLRRLGGDGDERDELRES